MIQLRFENRIYEISGNFSTVCEIEDELGSIGELLEKITQNRLKIAELAVIIQILLQSKGKTADYLQLGNLMLQEGVENYRAAAKKFFQMIMK